MTKPLRLDETELSALMEMAEGKTQAVQPPSAGLGSLAERGLVTLDGDNVIFSPELKAAFEPLATCKVHLMVMNDSGDPVDQWFIGEEEAAARVLPGEDDLGFERIEYEALPTAIAASLSQLLAASSETALPDASNFAAAADSLGLEGLKPLAWGGLAITRDAQASVVTGGAQSEWVLVVRCEPGFVWQDAGHGTVALAETEEDLA